MGEHTTVDMTSGVYRNVYSGFIRGKRINKVSLPAEAWFWRLNVLADDFGNLLADPSLLAREAGGRREVTVRQSESMLNELVNAGLVTIYEVNEDRYAHIVGFEEWQKAPRNGKRIRRVPSPVGVSGASCAVQIFQDSSENSCASENQPSQPSQSPIPNHLREPTKPTPEPNPPDGPEEDPHSSSGRVGLVGGSIADFMRAGVKQRAVAAKLAVAKVPASEFVAEIANAKRDRRVTDPVGAAIGIVAGRYAIELERPSEVAGALADRIGNIRIAKGYRP